MRIPFSLLKVVRFFRLSCIYKYVVLEREQLELQKSVQAVEQQAAERAV